MLNFSSDLYRAARRGTTKDGIRKFRSSRIRFIAHKGIRGDRRKTRFWISMRRGRAKERPLRLYTHTRGSKRIHPRGIDAASRQRQNSPIHVSNVEDAILLHGMQTQHARCGKSSYRRNFRARDMGKSMARISKAKRSDIARLASRYSAH